VARYGADTRAALAVVLKVATGDVHLGEMAELGKPWTCKTPCIFWGATSLFLVWNANSGTATVLVDLDAELIRIRDLRSRAYFGDALKCYRAGAFRAAISSTWVTVTYDLIRKYRELDGLGDAEAHAFLEKWDASVTANNVAKLLELERSLVDHAHQKIAIIDAMGLRALKRLYEDRHLSAHPAFATSDDLYEPSDELVRAHMAAAVELVLAQRPVQGRGIFEAFSTDIQSPGFPSAPTVIADYVEQKYLANMRTNILRNFGVVLAKSLIRNMPPEWEPYQSKLAAALLSLKMRRPAEWSDVETELVKLINDDEPGDRLRSIGFLASFPELIARLNHTALTALRQTVARDPSFADAPQAFAAVEIEEFRIELVGRFEALDDTAAARVLSATAPLPLWPNALSRYAASGSFRGAEARFDQFISPFRPIIDETQLDELFAAVRNNGQIWDASRTPTQLADLFRAIHPRRPSNAAIDQLYDRLPDHSLTYYDDTWNILEQRGWQRPVDSAT